MSSNSFDGDYKVIVEDTSYKNWNYRRNFIYNPTSEENIEATIKIHSENNVLLNTSKCTFACIPNSGLDGVKNILICGSSSIQKNGYVSKLYPLFTDCSVNLIGRYGFEDNSHREGIGSAPISWFNQSSGVCYFAKVSGHTEEATVNYITGGSKYRDSANNIYECRSNFADSDGNGYMELWGSIEPKIGILTKTEGPGSETVTINSVEEIDKNPFWNKDTQSVDWNWYLSKYGFKTPDIIVIDCWANSIRISPIDQFIEQHKIFIDNIHSQLPNCKVIIPCCSRGKLGREDIRSYIDLIGNNFVKLIDWLENNEEYKEFVTLSSNLAWVDPVNGFNIFKKVNEITKEEIQYHGDNVHYSDTGYTQVANNLYNTIRGVLMNL